MQKFIFTQCIFKHKGSPPDMPFQINTVGRESRKANRVGTINYFIFMKKFIILTFLLISSIIEGFSGTVTLKQLANLPSANLESTNVALCSSGTSTFSFYANYNYSLSGVSGFWANRYRITFYLKKNNLPVGAPTIIYQTTPSANYCVAYNLNVVSGDKYSVEAKLEAFNGAWVSVENVFSNRICFGTNLSASFTTSIACNEGNIDATGVIDDNIKDYTIEIFTPANSTPIYSVLSPGAPGYIALSSLITIQARVPYTIKLSIRNGNAACGTVGLISTTQPMYFVSVLPCGPVIPPDVPRIIKNSTTYGGDIEVYPNPSSDIITAKYPDDAKHFQLFDVMGKMMQQIPADGSGVQEFDISSFPKGIYFLKTDTGLTQKFIKE